MERLAQHRYPRGDAVVVRASCSERKRESHVVSSEFISDLLSDTTRTLRRHPDVTPNLIAHLSIYIYLVPRSRCPPHPRDRNCSARARRASTQKLAARTSHPRGAGTAAGAASSAPSRQSWARTSRRLKNASELQAANTQETARMCAPSAPVSPRRRDA